MMLLKQAIKLLTTPNLMKIFKCIINKIAKPPNVIWDVCVFRGDIRKIKRKDVRNYVTLK